MKVSMPAVSVLALLIFSPRPSFAQSCPGHAHIARTTVEGHVTTIHCECNADEGYTKYENKCRLKSELRDFLVHRAALALKAAAEPAKSLMYETARLGLTDFFDDNVAASVVELPTMLSVRNKEAQAVAALAVAARVGTIIGRVSACHGSETIKTSCANFLTFLNIARESLVEAGKL